MLNIMLCITFYDLYLVHRSELQFITKTNQNKEEK